MSISSSFHSLFHCVWVRNLGLTSMLLPADRTGCGQWTNSYAPNWLSTPLITALFLPRLLLLQILSIHVPTYVDNGFPFKCGMACGCIVNMNQPHLSFENACSLLLLFRIMLILSGELNWWDWRVENMLWQTWHPGVDGILYISGLKRFSGYIRDKIFSCYPERQGCRISIW